MRKYDETDRLLEAIGIPSPSRMMNCLADSWRKEQESKPINLNTTISAGLKEKKKEKMEKIISKLTTQLDEVIEKLPPEATINSLRNSAVKKRTATGGKPSRLPRLLEFSGCMPCSLWGRLGSAAGCTRLRWCRRR